MSSPLSADRGGSNRADIRDHETGENVDVIGDDDILDVIQDNDPDFRRRP